MLLTKSERRVLPPLTRAILLGILVGGSFLAFRWSTPFGNMTVARGFLLLALIGMGVGVLRLNNIPRSANPVFGTSLVVLLIVIGGLLYSPAPSTGLAVAGNMVEGMLILFATFFLAQRILHGSSSQIRASVLARLPLWGYLPTGLLGLYQAFQLLIGRRPTIPFLQLARLDESTLNSARTAFGSGLNDFNLDRVAAATGDPATYGIFSAATIGYCLWVQRVRLGRAHALHWIVMFLALCGVILSASVSAFLVLGVVLMCNIPDSFRGWRRLVLSGAVAVGALVVIYEVIPSTQGFVLSAQERFRSEAVGQGSAAAHLSLLSDAWQVFGSHPFLGVGTGGLTFQQYGYEVGFSSVHNVLLLGLAEGGIVLGAALFAFWLSLWRRFVPRAILLPLTAAWLVYLDFNRLPALWAVVGIVAALSWWQGHRRVPAGVGDVVGNDLQPLRRDVVARGRGL